MLTQRKEGKESKRSTAGQRLKKKESKPIKKPAPCVTTRLPTNGTRREVSNGAGRNAAFARGLLAAGGQARVCAHFFIAKPAHLGIPSRHRTDGTTFPRAIHPCLSHANYPGPRTVLLRGKDRKQPPKTMHTRRSPTYEPMRRRKQTSVDKRAPRDGARFAFLHGAKAP